MRRFAALLASCVFAAPVAAQDNPNTILVMDGSGSMWGQIDGVAKITIAQEVVGELLQTIPDDQGLGLTVYGHRERGNCTDIETVVAPAPGTRDQIAAAVNSIQPLGKTPMTDAIIAAAEALRYTEDSATVILVSDGVETCNPDPCAAARLLEQAGIDFTAHVIGFDVGSDQKALAQMQCLAEETGGQFLTAENAAELGTALTAVVEEPEIITSDVTFRAVLGDESGPLIEDPILWNVSSDSGETLIDEQANPAMAVLLETTHRVTAYRLTDELELETTVTISDAAPQTVTVVFPEATPTASLTAPDEAPAGTSIMVEWDGPNESADNVQIAEIGGSYLFYTYTSEGNPLSLQMPAQPGNYELRYVLNDRETIATRPITVTEIELGLDAPDTVSIGQGFDVTWTGPDAPTDNIQVAEIGGSYISYEYTSRGNPSAMTAPGTPGDYELRYVFLDRETIFTRPITVVEAELSLTAPETVPVGSDFEVTWEGPNAPLDNIQIAEIGGRYSDYAYTERGNPVTLTAPGEIGDYELRYVFGDRETLFTRPITVVEEESSLQFTPSAPIGASVTVAWDGPDNANDYIAVGKVGERYNNYTRTSTGNPLVVVMPTEPGMYEIRYHLNEGSTIIASAPIEVTDLKGSLTAPDTVTAGESVVVGWDGPDYQNDYISVALPGERYINYTRTSQGNPLELLMPTEPGDYEVRYHMNQDAKVLASVPISVVAVGASLTAPPEALAGSTVTVGWDGPDYQNDYIAVAEPGEGWINYTRTSRGNPLELLMPTEPGDYEIRYQLNQGGEILATIPITLTANKVELTAPATAVIGATIDVGWDGPDNPRDYIAVGDVGDDNSVHYVRTSEGTPLRLRMPAEPGEYEIRYHLDQGRTVLRRTAITIEPVKAQILFPPSAPANTIIQVGWDGPGSERDYISIHRVGEQSPTNRVRVTGGNPVDLRLPRDPGTYEIRYTVSDGAVAIANEVIEVTAAE